MSTNRVVVTGYGVTSPIGNTPEEFWNSLHDGKIGIKPITKFDASEIPVFNAGEIQDFPFDKYFVNGERYLFESVPGKEFPDDIVGCDLHLQR